MFSKDMPTYIRFGRVTKLRIEKRVVPALIMQLPHGPLFFIIVQPIFGYICTAGFALSVGGVKNSRFQVHAWCMVMASYFIMFFMQSTNQQNKNIALSTNVPLSSLINFAWKGMDLYPIKL